MVDYDFNGGQVLNFRCCLADWGTAANYHHGGTPIYAGPRAYQVDYKDLFSFGRLVLELFLKQEGNMNNLLIFGKFELLDVHN